MKTQGLVENRTEIEANLHTIHHYSTGSAQESAFHRARIKNGKNFVAKRTADGWLFAPSKFAGYAKNDSSHIDKLNDRDGGVTNGRITELLGEPVTRGESGYDEVYAAYCDYARQHGFSPSKHPRGRKYWII